MASVQSAAKVDAYINECRVSTRRDAEPTAGWAGAARRDHRHKPPGRDVIIEDLSGASPMS